MSDADDIPILKDLIESGPEITLSDLGLEDDPAIGSADPGSGDFAFSADEAAPMTVAGADDAARTGAAADEAAHAAGTSGDISPALEQAVRRILEKHMKLAWREIRVAIRQHLDRS